MPLDRKHILKQSTALLKMGVSVQDAERTIAFVEAHLPEGADPNTWIPTEADLRDGLISEAAVLDARMAFYGKRDVPRKYRRILDATSEK